MTGPTRCRSLGVILCSVAGLAWAGTSPPGPETGNWWEAAIEGIRRSEYEFSSVDDATWTAPSRSQGLRSLVSNDGLKLVPFPAEGSPWGLELAIVGFGRGNELVEPGVTREILGDGHRVELLRERLTEWYVNLPLGLEQGFLVLDRPRGRSAEPIVIDMLAAGAALDLVDDGHEVLFRTESGRTLLSYAGLVVFDADGRRLPSWLEVAEDHLRILVDDERATYPLLVDPLLTNPDWSSESNQANSRFGESVASAGDVNGDGYDDVIVGAESFNNEGRAFVFYGSPTGPSTTPSWTVAPQQLVAEFGQSVDSAGDVNGDGYDDIIVGASEYDGVVPNDDEGWAFVFHGSPTGLAGGPNATVASANWHAEGNQLEADFGRRVRGAGDLNGDGFDDVAIGAPIYSSGQENEGAAFVFYGSPSGLNNGVNGTPQNAPWFTDSGQVDSLYGHSLAGAGDVNNDGYDDLIVGARQHFVNFGSEGRFYLYLGSAAPAGLSQTPVVVVDGGQSDIRLGVSVAGVGDVNGDLFDDVLVGADTYSDPPDVQPNEGGAFLYYGSAAGLASSTPAWTGQGDQTDAFYGFSVAGAGDVNADGYADILVGADMYDDGDPDEGAAFLYLGSPNGPPTTPTWTLEIEQPGARFGHSVASAGDVNNDGFDDVLIGAHRFTKLLLEEGAAFAFLGCADGDSDGACQATDNCPDLANPDQLDTDLDGIGNVCDPCEDADMDGVCDAPRVLVESSGPGERVLLDFGSFMRYLPNTEFVNPGVVLEWTQLIYPDELSPPWATGFYGVGYETEPAFAAENLLITTNPPNPGTVSVFSRALFSIPVGTNVENIFLGVDYDDGYVAWINGVEVFRSPEMPGGVPLWNAKPTTHESSNGTQPNFGELHDISSGIPALNIGGSNVLAIGVWNTSQGSTDLVLVPRLSINRPTSSTMAYLANANDPGLGQQWTQTGFDEQAQGWTDGNYGVGYETGTGAEDLINTGVSPSSRSVFTRTRFNLSPDIVDSLFLGADYDDGYAAWINGQEVYRSPEMPGNPGDAVGWSANPTEHESSNGALPDYGTLVDITGAPLFQGENVLAVGVWRNDLSGIDDLVLVPRLSINEGNEDNCVGTFNPPADCDGIPGTPNEQCDMDDDGLGDACDPDIDGDTLNNGVDNCPLVSNLGQLDFDSDLVGDVCDSCPDDAANDVDMDRICAGIGFSAPKVGDQDNCPTVSNPPADCDAMAGTPDEQCDLDLDGLGDECDPDIDGDLEPNATDNCPLHSNASQTDTDLDDVGDLCDCAETNDQAWQIAGTIDSVRMVRADLCRNFSCLESGGPCEVNADCDFDFCENKACSDSLGPCGTDVDCEIDTCENFTCSFGPNSCLVDAECTADFCENRFCTAGVNPACNSDAECTADFCQNMNCLAPPFEPCTSNFDCNFGAGQCFGTCSVGMNICQPTNAQCVADTCGDGTCVVGGAVCSDDSTCDQDFCQGLCSVGLNTCTTDVECIAAQVDLCQGTCSIVPSVCVDNADCTAPQTDLCEGKCTIGGNDCTSGSACSLPAVDTLFWQEPADIGGTSVVYDTLRSTDSSDFTIPATCVETDGTDQITSDATTPAPGGIVYYLIRIENECPDGNMATDSGGNARTGLVCE